MLRRDRHKTYRTVDIAVPVLCSAALVGSQALRLAAVIEVTGWRCVVGAWHLVAGQVFTPALPSAIAVAPVPIVH